MRKIRIAQIGMNIMSHSGEIFNTLKSLPEIFEIVGYALVEDERETCAAKLGVFEGYPELTPEEILNDPTIEAVTVETDEIHLNKYATMAAEHGKHIHMEKPGSQSLADFERLIETVRAGEKTFHIGYMYRYNPYITDAIKRAQAGEFGEVYAVEAQMGRLDTEEGRRWLGHFKGGMMFYLGCHLVDLVLQIQGLPQEVLPLNCSIDPDGIGTEDYAMAVLKYRNGVSFVKTTACETDGFPHRQLVIMGTKGMIEVKPLEDFGNVYPLLTTSRVECMKGKARVAATSDPFDRYESMMRNFAAMVRGEKENPFSLDYELTLFRLLLRCCGMQED